MTPQRATRGSMGTLSRFVSYRRLSPHFQFSLPAVTLGIYLIYLGGGCRDDGRLDIFSTVHNILIRRDGRKVRLIDFPIPIRSSDCIGRYNRSMASSDFCIDRLCRSILSSDSFIHRSCFLVSSSDFCIRRFCRSLLSSDSFIDRSCFLVLSSDFCIVGLCQ
jgi:hypothetical protein